MPHNVEIPDYVIERVMAKRGHRNVFDHFPPEKTALVIIDMQNFFVSDVDMAISIVPNINRLATAHGPGRMHGLDRHVKARHHQQDDENRYAPRRTGVHSGNRGAQQTSPDKRVDNPFRILAVVHSSDPGNEAGEKG